MRNFFLVACFGLMTFGLSAQIAIKAGVNFASISEKGDNTDSEDLDKNSISGLVLGAAFKLPISSAISLQPEFLFIQKGGRNVSKILGIENESRYKLNYLEVPVLIRAGAPLNGDGGFYLAAGPWAGMALNGNYKVTTTGLGNSSTVEDDFTFDDVDDAKRLDFGLSFGAGFSLGRVDLDARYNYGINNLLDNDADNNNDNKATLQTRGISLTASYAF